MILSYFVIPEVYFHIALLLMAMFPGYFFWLDYKSERKKRQKKARARA